MQILSLVLHRLHHDDPEIVVLKHNVWRVKCLIYAHNLIKRKIKIDITVGAIIVSIILLPTMIGNDHSMAEDSLSRVGDD